MFNVVLRHLKVLNQNFVKPILNWVTGPKPKTEDTSVLTTADSVELTPQPSQKDEKAQIKAERRRHALRVGSLAAGGAAVIAAAPLLGPAATVGAVLLGTGAVFQSLTGALTASGPGSAGALLVSWFGMGMPQGGQGQGGTGMSQAQGWYMSHSCIAVPCHQTWDSAQR